jgi:nitrogen fixation protein FixH
MKQLGLAIRRNAWPIGIALVILAFFTIDGALVFTAFRDKATAPEENYYDKAIHFDQLRASSIRSSEAGWKAQVLVAEAPLVGMPRRVDVTVHDRSGKPVVGLLGSLTAVRPADARLSSTGALVEVPGEQGTYRLLLKLPARGLWEFQLEARKGSDSYRMVIRQDVVL